MRAVQETHHLGKVADAIDLKFVHHGSLLDVLHGHEQGLVAKGTRLDGNGQSTADGLERTVKTQFAHHHYLVQTAAVHLLCRSQYAYGYGKVETASHLAHVGRSQVNGNLLAREGETAVLQGGGYTLVTFLDGIVRQTHQDKADTTGTVHLDGNLLGLQPLHRCAIYLGKHDDVCGV